MQLTDRKAPKTDGGMSTKGLPLCQAQSNSGCSGYGVIDLTASGGQVPGKWSFGKKVITRKRLMVTEAK